MVDSAFIFVSMISSAFVSIVGSASPFVSIAALILSGLSFCHTRKFRLESNRPIIIVRVSTHTSGNIATTLNLVVENTGNRPAKNIKLSVDPQKLASALRKNPEDNDRQVIERCFENIIPLLANGKLIVNSFGQLTHHLETSSLASQFWISPSESDWEINARFDVSVQYQGLDDRNFKDCIPVLIASDEGFAGSAWSC
jgi:hypothetical protein